MPETARVYDDWSGHETVIAGCIPCGTPCSIDATIGRDAYLDYSQKYSKMPIPDCD